MLEERGGSVNLEARGGGGGNGEESEFEGVAGVREGGEETFGLIAFE